jgi:hypothetical protein
LRILEIIMIICLFLIMEKHWFNGPVTWEKFTDFFSQYNAAMNGEYFQKGKSKEQNQKYYAANTNVAITKA